MWKSQLTDVIELTENHRQPVPVWAARLDRLRINKPNIEDLEVINNRHVDVLAPAFRCPPPHTITAVSLNSSRETGLRYFEKRMNAEAPAFHSGDFEWKPRGILLIQARVTRKEGHQTVASIETNPTFVISAKSALVLLAISCALLALLTLLPLIPM